MRDPVGIPAAVGRGLGAVRETYGWRDAEGCAPWALSATCCRGGDAAPAARAELRS